jgi:hypothetical protein
VGGRKSGGALFILSASGGGIVHIVPIRQFYIMLVPQTFKFQASGRMVDFPRWLHFFTALWVFSYVLSAQSSVPARILIYSATADYRHDSIPTAIQALKAQGPSINVVFDNSEDQSIFNDQGLAVYDALLFLDNTGEGDCLPFGMKIQWYLHCKVLNDTGKAALQKYLDLGGGFIAIHAASDCLRNTTFYGNEVGTFSFLSLRAVFNLFI